MRLRQQLVGVLVLVALSGSAWGTAETSPQVRPMDVPQCAAFFAIWATQMLDTPEAAEWMWKMAVRVWSFAVKLLPADACFLGVSLAYVEIHNRLATPGQGFDAVNRHYTTRCMAVLRYTE